MPLQGHTCAISREWKAHQAKIPVDFLNYMYIDHNHTKQVRKCTDNGESQENIANEVKSKEIWKIRHSEEKNSQPFYGPAQIIYSISS